MDDTEAGEQAASDFVCVRVSIKKWKKSDIQLTMMDKKTTTGAATEYAHTHTQCHTVTAYKRMQERREGNCCPGHTGNDKKRTRDVMKGE